MPSYEMTLILQAMARPALADALKRNITVLMKQGAIITNVDNLGYRRLPYQARRQGMKHQEGNYFLLSYEAPPNVTVEATKLMSKDKEVIKHRFCLQDDGWVAPCSLPNAKQCEFGEIKNPNYEKFARRLHGFRWY